MGQKQSTSHGTRSRAAAKSVALLVNTICLEGKYNWSPKRDGKIQITLLMLIQCVSYIRSKASAELGALLLVNMIGIDKKYIWSLKKGSKIQITTLKMRQGASMCS